jgi:hypothetical protein
MSIFWFKKYSKRVGDITLFLYSKAYKIDSFNSLVSYLLKIKYHNMIKIRNFFKK